MPLLLLLLFLKVSNIYCQTASKETGLVSIPTCDMCGPGPHPTIVLRHPLLKPLQGGVQQYILHPFPDLPSFGDILCLSVAALAQ